MPLALLALGVVSTLLLAGGRASPREPALDAALASVTIADDLPVSTVLESIVAGSCLHQSKPQPIWSAVLARRPQLLLMMGDNVYGDFKSSSARELVDAYIAQVRHPDFSRVRAAVPILPVWDDHDFGLNDGGADFAFQSRAAELFHQFWRMSPPRPVREGVHYSRSYGPPGRRVQIIMLDTRSFRSPLRLKSDAFRAWGKFEPDPDPSKTLLGEAQWNWLEAELRRPADLRLVVSSIQVLAEGHGWERWGNLPHERARFLRVLRESAGTTVLLSGDRHAAALYRERIGDRELVELTASSLNLPPPGPNRDERVAPLVSGIFTAENFGAIAIDWTARRVRLSIHDGSGRALAEELVGIK